MIYVTLDQSVLGFIVNQPKTSHVREWNLYGYTSPTSWSAFQSNKRETLLSLTLGRLRDASHELENPDSPHLSFHGNQDIRALYFSKFFTLCG